jgi:hypothetical protein
MAELLIEDWQLAVLRVDLDLSPSRPEVVVSLSTRADGEPQELAEWREPLEAFGIGEDRQRSRRPAVPADLADRIGSVVRKSINGEPALWLRLVPPYGYLGAVPWERAMAHTGLPMLRIPDRLPPAADPGNVFTMVIAVCARAGSSWAPPYVLSLLNQLRVRLPGTLDIHVFADAHTARMLEGDLATSTWQHVHDPTQARSASAARSRSSYPDSRVRLRTVSSGEVWAGWIAAGLARRAARAVHIVSDAHWDGDRPVLRVTPDPAEQVDEDTVTTISAEQLVTLTDLVGAATLSIASPPDNAHDDATRIIADLLGRTRGGPTLYSSIEEDPTADALARAYRTLLVPNAGVPQDPSLFAYLQPEHVLDIDYPVPDDGTVSSGDSPLTVSATFQTFYAAAEAVPLWAAATQRYVEAGLTSLDLSATSDPQFGVKQAYDRGAAAALADIQALMANYIEEG